MGTRVGDSVTWKHRRPEWLRRVFGVIVVGATVAVVAGAQGARAQERELVQSLERLEDQVVERTLSNGMRVLLVKRSLAPVFSAVVTVGVGGVDERLGETGVSHMLEHMAFKGGAEIGTRDAAREAELLAELEEIAARAPVREGRSPEDSARWDEISRELESLATGESIMTLFESRGAGDFNATTSADITNYMVSLPVDQFELWCWLESKRLFAPVMRQFYQERDVVNEERYMRYENSPMGKLYEHLLSIAFRVHPYRNPVIGYPDDIVRVTAAETADFQRRYYVPENMVLAIVGDIEVEPSMALLERYFGSYRTGEKRPPKPSVVEPKQEGERTFELVADASPEVVIAYRKPTFPHPDDVPLSLAAELLAGSSVTPLYKRLVREKRLATSVSYEEAPGTRYPNLLLFHGVVRAPHTREEFLREFDTLLDGFVAKPDTRWLEAAKRNIAMGFLGALRSDLTLAKELSAAEIRYDEGWRVLLTWTKAALAVTPEEIADVSKRYLVRSNRVVATIRPRAAEAGKGKGKVSSGAES